MASQSVVCIYLIIIYSVNVNSSDFCGDKRVFEEPKGVIKTNDKSRVPKNCTWSINTPAHSVVYLEIEKLQFEENETNCLLIESRDKQHIMNLCSDMEEFSNTLSIPANNLLISLKITSQSQLSMTYTSYMVKCQYHELLCFHFNKFLSENPGQVCDGGMLVCDTSCRGMATPCGDFCYDIMDQRCDGILDCLQAEDELGCNPTLCPNKIQCLNETKCVESTQICDKKPDCKNGFDESNCPNNFCDGHGPSCFVENTQKKQISKEDGIYILVIILAVLAILFMCMIFKCLAARENVRRLLNNPLDIPLPPFRGPGEGLSTEEDNNYYTEDDFKPGGDIYESFKQNITKIQTRRKNLLELEDGGITFVKPAPGKNVWDKYFPGVKPVLSEELAALATIKISRDKCYGLRKTRSEELPMTIELRRELQSLKEFLKKWNLCNLFDIFEEQKLDESISEDLDDDQRRFLFIDNIDKNLSEESNMGETGSSSNCKMDIHTKEHPKSDTSYVRRKRVEITIV